MNDATIAQPAETSTSLPQRLTNVLVAPSEVFDEVMASPVNLVNWRIPTLLVCLSGIVLRQATAHNSSDSAIASLSQYQNELFDAVSPLVSSLVICLTAFVGSLWCAFLLWFIGCTFLRTRFSFLKSLEISGLTGSIGILGSIVTLLLIGASGDSTARPALTLLAGKSIASRPHEILAVLNIFHLWTTGVLAVGLSKLSGVSFKEAAFWVFGYWFFARIGLILLA